jgi:spore coat protein U-like protein
VTKVKHSWAAFGDELTKRLLAQRLFFVPAAAPDAVVVAAAGQATSAATLPLLADTRSISMTASLVRFGSIGRSSE